MNAPTPGWHPDPTGRHEYRYWEGGAWTDDVSDGGATSVDPIGSADAPAAPADPTQQYAPQYSPQQPGPQPGPQGGTFPGGGPGYGGYPSSSGQFPAGQPVKSGPSTGLLVGLAAVAVALIAGIAFLVTNSGDDGDDTATDETSSTDDTSSDDTSSDDTTGTTEPDDTNGDGDLDIDDIDEDMSTEGIVDLMAIGIQQSSDQITEEQARCAAQVFVDELGAETIMEMSMSGTNPMTDGSLTTEQQVAIVSGMTSCIPAEVLAEMGME